MERKPVEPDTTGTVGFLSDKIEVWAAQIRFLPFVFYPAKRCPVQRPHWYAK